MSFTIHKRKDRAVCLWVYDCNIWIRFFTILVIILFPLAYSYAGENIILYCQMERDKDGPGLLRKYLEGKGYNISIYEKAATFEKHLENVNRINRAKASLMLAVDFRIGDKNDVFIAVAHSNKGDGKFLAIDEIPALHIARSMEIAECVASSFGKTVKCLPLLPFLGIDMPGIFLRMECNKDNKSEMLNILNDCLQKYFMRGKKNEKQRKGK